METYFTAYSEARKEVSLKTIENFPEEISWYKRLFNEISNLLDFIVPISTPVTDEMKVSKEFMILSSSIKIKFYSASVFDLCCTGNYAEATALLRTIIEDMECIVFFNTYPEKIEDWVNDKYTQKQILSFLDKNSQPIERNFRELTKAYSFASKYIHPSKQVLKNYIHIDNTKLEMSFKLEPTFMEKECQGTLIPLNSMLYGLLKILKIIFLEKILEIGIEEDITRIIDEYTKYYLELSWI